jgi:hypothetical protein
MFGHGQSALFGLSFPVKLVHGLQNAIVGVIEREFKDRRGSESVDHEVGSVVIQMSLLKGGCHDSGGLETFGEGAEPGGQLRNLVDEFAVLTRPKVERFNSERLENSPRLGFANRVRVNPGAGQGDPLRVQVMDPTDDGDLVVWMRKHEKPPLRRI